MINREQTAAIEWLVTHAGFIADEIDRALFGMTEDEFKEQF